MQQPSLQAVSVVIDGHDHTSNALHRQPPRKGRPLNVDEALQFSPLTTSPATGLDRIPLPELGCNTNDSHLVSDEDRAALQKSLEALKKPQFRSQYGAQEYLRVVGEVRKLLDEDDLPEFQLKSRHQLRSWKSKAKPTSTTTPSQLSPFATMVLDSTNVAYRYPSPSTPSPAIKPARLPSFPATPHNEAALRQNAAVSRTGLTPSTPNGGTPVIVVPTLPESEREKYVTLPGSPKRRKVAHAQEGQESAIHLRAQKDEADAAVANLEELMYEIFEAEDHLQPDTSVAAAPRPSQFFDSGFLDENGLPRLSLKTHTKMQNALKTVARYDRLHNVSAEYIKRLQRLCEGGILSFESPKLPMDSNATEDSLLSWHDQLQGAEDGAVSACTFICMILGNLQDKELCPEEIISKFPTIVRGIIEDCIMPVVELRSSGKAASSFASAKSVKDSLLRLATQSRKLLELLTDLNLKMKDTTALNTIVDLGPKLISLENPQADKDSILGFQAFETFRRTAMNILCKIFSSYPQERDSILDNILTSLSRLPTTKHSARQYKLADGRNIQVVSALFMQLVQATAMYDGEIGKSKRQAPQKSHAQDGTSQHFLLDSADDDVSEEIDDEEDLSLISLQKKIEPASQVISRNAQLIMQQFLGKAVGTRKNGDDKHRNLLELFIEDLMTVLGSPEWPASELFLRSLSSNLFRRMSQKDTPAVEKNMALEILGWMGSSILNLKGTLAKLFDEHDENDRGNLQTLRQLADEQLAAGLRLEDLITINGPYRAVLEYLEEKDTRNWHLNNAKRFSLVQWAKMACSTIGQEGQNENSDAEDVANVLSQIFDNPRYLESEREYVTISTSQARLAYHLVLLNSPFGKYLDYVIRVLLDSMVSDQAKTRSRSLKSIVSLLEIDSKLLDRDTHIMQAIFHCTTDGSPLVRESALSLIGKYISVTPSLLNEGCYTIFRCSEDSSTGVRKKCISLLRDIYRSEQGRDLQVPISHTVLQRIRDSEDSVALLARQTLEELWLADLAQKVLLADGNDTARMRVAVSSQTWIIVRTLQRHEDNCGLLEGFLRGLFVDKVRVTVALERCCKAIVTDIFDTAVTSQNDRTTSNGEALLQTLTVFGKVRPNLIDATRLEELQPYLTNLKSEDLPRFRSIVIIFQSVLPHLSIMEKSLLVSVQSKLFDAIQKLNKPLLDEVMACLWTIHGVLHETARFTRVALSCLKGGLSMRGEDLTNANNMVKVRGYLRILGSIGKNWDLESYVAHFKNAYPTMTETSIAGMFAEFAVPFTIPGQPLPLRATALESLGSVCQGWPGQFNKSNVQKALLYVFSEADTHPDLQNIVLQMFAGFFGIRENAIETFASTSGISDPQEPDLGRLSGSLKANEHDSAAAIIGSHFLRPMLQVAKTRLDQSALTAIRVIASINRQGLVHPKECASAFVALGTSSNQAIAKVAIETHRILHQQHESLFEREYMRAVQETFEYQKNIVQDTLGASARPFTPKLRPLFDIIKISNAKYVKKFLHGLIVKSSFDFTNLETVGNPPDAVLLSRFVMQNLAFLEYARTDDLLDTIAHMEGVIGKIGVDIAQAIESRILKTAISLIPEQQNGEASTSAPLQPDSSYQSDEVGSGPVDPSLLARLTIAAMILSIIHETRAHLKRQYGITIVHQTDGKKKDTKEMNRVPVKVHGVTGDRFWDSVENVMGSLENGDSMKARCQQFVTLMSVDEEVRIAADYADERVSNSASVDLDESMANTPSGRKRPGLKRKSSISVSGTPKKKKGRPRKSSVQSDDSDEDWQ